MIFCDNEKNIDFIIKDLGDSSWIPLYQNLDLPDKSIDGAFYCCLIKPDELEKGMTTASWCLGYGDGVPSIVYSGEKIWYEENSSEYTPLVHYRDFYGNRKRYFDVSQELVLFHNLYNDAQNSKYVIDDKNGNEIVVIRYTSNKIEIRRKFLFSYMAAKQEHLLLQFEITTHRNDDTIKEDIEIREKNLTLLRYWGNSYNKEFSTFNRILGKKLILAPERTKESVEPFEYNREYEEFIYEGDSIEYKTFSCKPDDLSNYFVRNDDAPHYLTPIFFKKEVLNKYYEHPSKYSVTDSLISMHGFWNLRLDNNHSDHISVFLGDLGRDIPHEEQVYWKSFNIPPEGRMISTTYYRRSILGSFSEAELPEHKFKNEYDYFQKNGLANLIGIYLYHYLKTISIAILHYIH